MSAFTTSRRIQGWERALVSLLDDRQERPFKWGPNDCASFCADAVLCETGSDLLAELRSPRRNERDAIRYERTIGCVADALDRAGLRMKPLPQAGRGDLVMFRQHRRNVLALCMGEYALAPGPVGLAHRPTREALCAWAV